MGALTRVLQEDFKKSAELTFTILKIFLSFSNFVEMHALMGNYRIGLLTMKVPEPHTHWLRLTPVHFFDQDMLTFLHHVVCRVRDQACGTSRDGEGGKRQRVPDSPPGSEEQLQWRRAIRGEARETAEITGLFLAFLLSCLSHSLAPLFLLYLTE